MSTKKPMKVALITGASRGIGLETARGLGKLGITVILGVRDKATGAAMADILSKDGILAESIRYDANDPSSFDEIRALIETEYGMLDILVNNAGISPEKELGAMSTVSVVTAAMLKDTFQTNFFAVVELTQRLLPLLKKAPAARIVNVSSVLGSLALNADPTSPFYGLKMLAYNSSKAALNSFTIHLAYELRDTKIKVNAAHPGWVRTAMGGSAAPLDVPEGAKTSIELALLDENGPTGGYFHLGKTIPW